MPTTKSVLLGLLLTASTAYSIPQPIPRATARVDAKLAQTAATLPEGGIISFSVQLKDLPAVDVPKGMNDRDEVGKFVYETLAVQAKKSQSNLETLLTSLAPEIKYQKHYIISNTLIIDGTSKVFSALSTHPDVLAITSNADFDANLPQPVSSFAPVAETEGWNLRQVKAPEVWKLGFTGGNLTYGSADTGVQWDHPELKHNYLGIKPDGSVDHNYAWFDGVRRLVDPSKPNPTCPPSSPEPCDDGGHGTHVMSTAVGLQTGVAPSSKWLACRNMDNGLGRPETYLNCLEWFLAPTDLNGQNPDPSKRPHAIGNSYGCPKDELCEKTTFDTALKNLRSAGIFMSVSAGNSFREERCNSVSSPPAISPQVMSVAALDSSSKIASFSSRGYVPGRGPTGRGVDISAPGVNIRAGWPGSTYNTISGTSMAAPHVGGMIMLIADACPQLRRDVNKITDLIYSTAMPLNVTTSSGCKGDTAGSVPNSVFGFGQIDVLKAVNKCRGSV